MVAVRGVAGAQMDDVLAVRKVVGARKAARALSCGPIVGAYSAPRSAASHVE